MWWQHGARRWEEVEGGGGSGGGRPGRNGPREGGGEGVELGDEVEAVGLTGGGGEEVTDVLFQFQF
jgi:hypothetical protein